ncbi:MAG: crAss001_48 related protein [Paraclostridium sp.]
MNKILNHLQVFKIDSCLCNVAGEFSNSKVKEFCNNEEFLENEIRDFIMEELGYDHVDRIKSELNELEVRISKLKSFLHKEEVEPKFTNAEQRDLLRRQLVCMEEYADILKIRLK